jgi:hypothetical protein
MTMDDDNYDAEEVHPDQVRKRFHSDPASEQGGQSSKPHLGTQADLKDLVRDLDLPKIQAEILAS